MFLLNKLNCDEIAVTWNVAIVIRGFFQHKFVEMALQYGWRKWIINPYIRNFCNSFSTSFFEPSNPNLGSKYLISENAFRTNFYLKIHKIQSREQFFEKIQFLVSVYYIEYCFIFCRTRKKIFQPSEKKLY